MTRVLVTNDDGIDSPGLRHLAQAAITHNLDVVIAAPSTEQSAMSAALSVVTDEGRVPLRPTTVIPGVPAFAVPAAPAYIVLLATLGVFGDTPDLVLSGINRGANAGHLILHSGTVGAALTAATNDSRGLAVSLDILGDTRNDPNRHHWSTATSLTARLIPWLLTQPVGTALNLNVPDRPLPDLAGLRQATLAPRGQTHLAVKETGDAFVRIAGEEDLRDLTPDTDLALLRAGYATVTPIRSAEAANLHIPLP
jgi:5'-nucleotidase